jgi:hypothetical protein
MKIVFAAAKPPQKQISYPPPGVLLSLALL